MIVDFRGGCSRTAHAEYAFDRFCALVEATSGHPFRGFDEGLPDEWESYKPRLRDHALGLLRPEDWLEDEIGSGAILNRTIKAIEIQDSRLKLTNNLVFWQNRFGPANRDHRAMLEAASNPVLRGDIESLLFGLYRGSTDESVTFDGLVGVTGGRYPLLAYLFFLKDIDLRAGGRDEGRVLSGRELSVIEMRNSVENTVRNSKWADGRVQDQEQGTAHQCGGVGKAHRRNASGFPNTATSK